MPTVEQVRSFLNDLPASRVSDTAIQSQIEVANITVEGEKGSAATLGQIDTAKLIYASFLTLQAYARQFERSVGGTPPEISSQLSILETVTTAIMAYIKRGSPTFVPLIAQPATLEVQWNNGDLGEENY